MSPAAGVSIREARARDIPALARLAGELGYATAEGQMHSRFERVVADKEHRVYVAESTAGQVIGWAHVHLTRYLATDIRGEIAGLIVDSTARSRGIGAQLLRAAEEWTKVQGGAALLVRSNIIRKNAHRFYERAGYAVTKTSLNFSKSL